MTRDDPCLWRTSFGGLEGLLLKAQRGLLTVTCPHCGVSARHRMRRRERWVTFTHQTHCTHGTDATVT